MIAVIDVNAVGRAKCNVPRGEGVVAVPTIRNIEDDAKARLRVHAADGATVWSLSRRLFGGEQGVSLDPPSRAADRAPLDFDDPTAG